MQSDVKLSTKFLTAQRDHQIRMLVSVKGDAPVTRPPINLALVLDRSGSMSGAPLDEAKRGVLCGGAAQVRADVARLRDLGVGEVIAMGGGDSVDA